MNYIATFVFTLVLVAFDFWVVKNVTGRLLVGLRWWNLIKPDGSSEWIYESADVAVNDLDRRVFWYSLIGYPIFWVLSLFFNILRVEWALLLGMAVSLSGSNLYGYWMCHRKRGGDATAGVGAWARELAVKSVVEHVSKEPAAAMQIGKAMGL